MGEIIKYFDKIIFGNPLRLWVLAIGITLISLFLLRGLKKVVAHSLSELAKKTKTNLDDLAASLLNKTKPFFLLCLSFYLGTLVLTLPVGAFALVTTVAIIAFIIQAAIWGSATVSLWTKGYLSLKAEPGVSNKATINAISFIVKTAIWVVTFLLLLDNLGIDVTALIAGLGVGGIAVALAVQNVLGDLLASLSIVLDKPFAIGDFIIVGDYLGSVEHIGLKTTRLRSLSGEQIVFSNNDLLNSRIRNYKRMYERRIVFSFGVVYETPVEKVAAIPNMVKKIIEGQADARFDRAHFNKYGDFSLDYEVVYYVKKPDYNVYMDVQQCINLDMMRQFKAEGVEFAYPTQTLFINKGSTAQEPAVHI